MRHIKPILALGLLLVTMGCSSVATSVDTKTANGLITPITARTFDLIDDVQNPDYGRLSKFVSDLDSFRTEERIKADAAPVIFNICDLHDEYVQAANFSPARLRTYLRSSELLRLLFKEAVGVEGEKE